MVFVMQKTAYDVRISDWSSDVCSSDLARASSRLILPICNGALACGNWSSPKQATSATATFQGELCQRSGGSPSWMFQALRLEMNRSLHSIGRASCRERVCQYG